MDATTDDTTVHGLPWDTLFALRDEAAAYWHRRHGQRIPLEEYLSAGNEALTLAVQRYRPQGTASPQRTVELYLTWAMRGVPRTTAPAGEIVWGSTRTPRHRHTQTIPVDPHSPFWERRDRSVSPAETCTFVHELLADLSTVVAARPLQGFVLRALGWRWVEIAALHGYSTGWVQWHLDQIRTLCARRKAVWAHIPPVEG